MGIFKDSLAVSAETAEITQMTAVKMLIWTQPPGLMPPIAATIAGPKPAIKEAELGRAGPTRVFVSRTSVHHVNKYDTVIPITRPAASAERVPARRAPSLKELNG